MKKQSNPPPPEGAERPAPPPAPPGAINTHGMICDVGKHKGEAYTRIPVSYLKWMINIRHSHADIAAAELARRGTVTPDLDISGHAIDTASLRARKLWHESRGENEGLHAWLARMAEGALVVGIDDKNKSGVKHYKGLKLVFEMDGCWPVLKTVMKSKLT